MLKAIDLFAGAGGFSTGAKMAGVEVVWAANHWPEAVKFHSQNHPGALHSCQDLHQANWELVPKHDIILASPACQGHSSARAGQEGPSFDAARSTAWAVVACAEFHRSPFVVVENVKGFLTWSLFPAWKYAMELLGYELSINILDSADFGVPQQRVRVFIVASRRGLLNITAPNLAHIPARDLIRWNEGEWNLIDNGDRSPKTLAKFETGRRFGDRFVIGYYGKDTGRSVDKPIGTITTRDRFAIVKGDRMRMLSIDEAREAMGFPDTYQLPSQKKLAMHLLGNAVCPPVAAGIIEQIKKAA